MKLYLLYWEDYGYDQYSHAVVVANSPDEARTIHPNGRSLHRPWNDWDDSFGSWCRKPEEVTSVTYVGEAATNLKLGDVICASFHAG